ncbi:hypothetical protein RHSIM_Rhsim10G0038700 [Rhododendron simsii]|uniref:F-box associated domain-containing protein n=1 Tax=Rhododendron simsii TaxID=118357 RepID=A0A834LBV3_RHOSS|nr:hypothetical protein RHSIM_Rhsim10G0038700 [Rhododendron simsii]
MEFPNLKSAQIIGSCNGLVSICDYISDYRTIHILNPATRQVIKSIPVPPYETCQPHINTNINGTFNWLAYGSEGNINTILSFHMSDEVFQTIKIPDFLLKNHWGQLAMLNGSFAVIRYPKRGVVKTPLAILGIDVLFLVSGEGELISCDLRTQEIRNHQVYGVEQWMQVQSSFGFGFGFDSKTNDQEALKVETTYAPHHNRKRLRRMLQNGEVGDEVNRRMATIEVLRYHKTAATEEYEAMRLLDSASLTYLGNSTTTTRLLS